MDKRIIQAVAGSGKTTWIIESLNLEQRFLVVTYTENNLKIINERIMMKFGYLPTNIHTFTFFSFLYNYCLLPQENVISRFNYWKKSKGIDFKTSSRDLRYVQDSKISHYINKNNQYYSFRMSKLILKKESIFDFIKDRIEAYCDVFFVDEVQDLSANDFNLLLRFYNINVNILLLGDFYQHTFDTSNDGPTNANLYKDYSKYKNKFNDAFVFDERTLSKSYRCSQSVCQYVEQKLGIKIESHRTDSTDINEVIDCSKIEKIINDPSIKKLFYQTHYKYDIKNSDNWGNSKGSTFPNICVLLNPNTYKLFVKNDLKGLNPQTLRKLYVAITRTNGNLYFIEEKKISRFKIKH